MPIELLHDDHGGAVVQRDGRAIVCIEDTTNWGDWREALEKVFQAGQVSGRRSAAATCAIIAKEYETTADKHVCVANYGLAHDDLNRKGAAEECEERILLVPNP